VLRIATKVLPSLYLANEGDDPGRATRWRGRRGPPARELSDKPVRWIVLTHRHPDHALGAVCLDTVADRAGAKLVCHPATRRALAEHGARVRDELAPADPEASATLEGASLHLPGHLVETSEVFDLGGHRVEVFHPGADPAAHVQCSVVSDQWSVGTAVTRCRRSQLVL